MFRFRMLLIILEFPEMKKQVCIFIWDRYTKIELVNSNKIRIKNVDEPHHQKAYFRYTKITDKKICI